MFWRHIKIFNINNFGKEGNLPKEDMLEAIKDPEKIPLKYIELKHVKNKQNRNVPFPATRNVRFGAWPRGCRDISS